MIDPQGTPVSEIMRREFVTAEAKDRLDFAELVLRLGKFRHLPVLDGGTLVGIISNRDLLAASLTKSLSFPDDQRRTFLHSIDVEEVMTREVETVTPEAPVAEAAAKMVKRKAGCLPVVDAKGVVVGLVTETDLLRAAYLEPGEADSGE